MSRKTNMNITIKTGVIEPQKVNLRECDCKSSSSNLNEAFNKCIQSSGSDTDKCFGDHSRNGLIDTIVYAYNKHHNLILRPDDFWLAITTQFSFYMNKYSEELRDKFVDHTGKEDLILTYSGSLELESFDFRIFITDMKDEIRKNIKDDEFADWIEPSFTTTTDLDKIVGKVVLMSNLKEYFNYGCVLMCGIPSVTLLGEVSDWILLREKVDQLLKYDVNGLMEKWHNLLTPILDDLVLSASGKETNMVDFWQKSCDNHYRGSGPKYLSGWVTVFNVFSSSGDWRGENKTHPYKGNDPHRRIVIDGMKITPHADYDDDYDDLEFPVIETSEITSGCVEVPVKVTDINGEHEVTLVAGSFLSEIKDDGYTIKPRIDLGIYEKFN